MFISLKRALKLRKELEANLKCLELPTKVRISILVEDNLVDAMPVVNSSLTEFQSRLSDAETMSFVLADVRTKIAQANIQHDVERNLAQIADIDRKTAIRRKVISVGITPTAEELQAEIALAKKSLDAGQSSDRYERPDRDVNVSVIPAAYQLTISDSLADLKRSREALEEQRAAINATQQIEIADEHVALLQKYHML